MVKYAIIGSNSFSGSHLVDELLGDSNWVVGISRSPEKSALYLPYKARESGNFEFHQCDIRDSDKLMALLDRIRPDYVVNYAAQTEVYQSTLTPVEYFETNTLAVVRLCHELRSREWLKCYVQISSAEIYGDCEIPVREGAPLRPTTPYAASKAAADFYLLAAHKHQRFPVIIVRSTNVYGRGQQLYKVIPRAIIRLMKGQKVELHSGGTFVRPFLYIRDACRGVLKAIQAGSPGNIYHFAPPQNKSVAEVVQRICRRLGHDFRESTVDVEERTGHDLRYSLDWYRARHNLGWYPRVSFDQGLDAVIEWIEDNWEEIEKEPQAYVHKP